MELKALQDRLAALAAERDWTGLHSPKNLAMALGAETGALLELLKWLTEKESRHLGRAQTEVAAEAITDIVLYALRLADTLGIDIEAALNLKLPDTSSPAAVRLPDVEETQPVENEVQVEEIVLPPEPAEPLLPPEVPAAPPPAPPEPIRFAAPLPPPEPSQAIRAPTLEPIRAVQPKPEPVVAPAAPPETAPRPTATAAASNATPPSPRPPTPDVAPRQAEPAAPSSVTMPPTSGRGPKAPLTTLPLDKLQASVVATFSPMDLSQPISLDALMPKPPATPSGSPRGPAVPPSAPPDMLAPFPDAPQATDAERTGPPSRPLQSGAPSEPPARLRPEPPAERYDHVNPAAVKDLVRSLQSKVGGSSADDPLLRELHDEVETLRRIAYGSPDKRAWIASSLKTIRGMLEQATGHSFGANIRAAEHIGTIDRILKA